MKERLKTLKTDLLVSLVFVVLPMLLYWNVTVGNKTMIPADNLFQWHPWAAVTEEYNAAVPQNPLVSDLVIQNYAWKQFTLNSLQQGEIPLWNPYLFGGAPFLAAGQHGMYYPFSWLFLLLPMAKAYGWYTVSQLWLAGLLMYVFGRFLHMRRISAIIAGLVYQGCGFLVVSSAVFPMIIGAAAWLPLLLGCVEKVISEQYSTDSKQWPILWMACGAVALGLQILAGHIEITYYTLLIMAVYAGWRVLSFEFRVSSFKFQVRRMAVAGGQLLGMVLLGILLGAVQLVPFYEVGRLNFREGSMAFEEVQSLAFPKRHLLAFVMPNFYGNPAEHGYVDVFNGRFTPFTLNAHDTVNPRGAYSSDWGIKNYVEGAVYLGILPLFLAGLGMYGGINKRLELRDWRVKIVNLQSPIANSQHPSTLFFVGLGAFSLAFMFGTPLYALLYYGLPFINQLHTPFRWIFPFSLCVAVLAGFGADYLARTREGKVTSEQYSVNSKQRSLFALLSSPFFLWGRPSVITGLAGLSLWAGGVLIAGLYVSRAFYGRFSPLIERLFRGLVLADEAFPNAQAFYSYEFRQLFILGLMLVATGAVLRVSRCPIFVRKRPIWELMAVVALSLDLFLGFYNFHATTNPTLLAYQPAILTWLQAQPGAWRLTTFDPHGQKPLNANTPWLYNLQDIRGYDSIIPKQYTQFMAAIEPQNELPFNRIQPIANWEALNSPLLDVLGVKYVITAESITLPKFQSVWQGDGLQVYENLAVAPRAYTLPQTATVVAENALTTLQEYDPRRFVVITEGDWRVESREWFSNLQSPISNPLTPATITHYGNIEVVAETAVSTPAWFILNDSYFPGWKAFVRPLGTGEDEETEIEIHRVNGNFRGVLLEPGEWTVRFRYSPVSFQLGALGSAMGSVILFFGLVVWGWRLVVRPTAPLTTTRSLAKNSLAPMALSLFNKFIDFLYAAFYLRVLGPADAGSFATAIATAGLFEILSNFGLDILLIREVSQERTKAAHYLVNTTILRLVAAAVASLPVVVMVLGSNLFSTPLTNSEVLAIGFIMLGMVFSGMSKGVTGLFYVYEKAEVPAAMTTATTILRVGLGVTALLLGYGFVGLSAVSIIVNIITLASLVVLARNEVQRQTGHAQGQFWRAWQIDWALQRRMIGQGYPLMLIHLLQTVFISIDVVLLRLLLQNGREIAGWYQSAYKWFNALQIVPSFFTLALFPIISREIKRSPETARRMYQMSLKLMLLLALPVATIMFYLAYPLTQIVGGNEFLPHGAISLQLVIWSIPIGWLNSVTNYVLIALGLERMQPRAFAAGVSFNILTNLIFIPLFDYRAAAITTILSELVLLVMFDYYLRQKMQGIQWRAFLGRPFLITAVMLLLMLLGGQLHLLVGLTIGVITYPLGLWLLRVLGEEEKLILREILPARLRGVIK